MLEYGGTIGADAPALAPPPAESATGKKPVGDLLRLALAHRLLIVLLMLAGAVIGVVLSKTLPPRYIAVAQIYLDPRGLPGVEREPSSAQDSTGYINLVESQARIVSSQLVLDRVVASEALDKDPEFAPKGLSLFGAQEAPGEATRAAVRALAQRLTVRRPERTFIIEIAIASRDPAKAARIANAVAHAFIEVQSVLYAQSARETSTVLTARLEGLRHQLLNAERQVEEFKARNGLIGTREQLVSDQQLRDVNQQLTLARVRTEDARARSEQVQKALRERGDLGPLTESLNLGSVTALRGRVAEAQRQLADLSSDLGPLHPLVKKAQSVLADARKAMDTESKRIANSFKRDYERAAAAQAAIENNLATAQKLTIANNETAVRLRDLEREADATRTLYESFLNRARRTGEAPDIDGTSTHIVSMAVPPKDRTSPPGGLVSMIAGALAGLVCGLGLIWLRAGMLKEMFARRRTAPILKTAAEPAEGAAPIPVDRRLAAPPIQTFRVTPASGFRRRASDVGADRMDVTRIGLPALGPSSTLDEFHPVLDFLHARGSFEDCRSVAILGRNDLQQRTTLALNLALAASLSGEATALFEADEDGNRLTQAIASRRAEDQDASDTPVIRTANRILLAQVPQSDEETEWTRSRVVRTLKDGERPIDWLFCDGPSEIAGPGLARFFDAIDDIILVLTQHDHAMDEVSSLRRELGRNGEKIAACILVDTAIFALKPAMEAV
ncbi:MAG: polysaccharide biosynthesis transport protein [Methylobacteriaceae bacterium]|nr:polysaccharide biosynthesis transport protein [Methylobacteriaceae bacterium]